tara:strand:+ start:8108 stop:8506 length:399 start_codon:yes stop_codon:yes gene_type:complete
MVWDIDSIESKLDKVSKDLDDSNEQFKVLTKKLYKKDETTQTYEVLKEILSEDEAEYFFINEIYKYWISHYSKEYIEMSDWYYGPELPYDIYCKEIRKYNGTYLDSSKDIGELYALFIFFTMYQFTLSEMKK